VDLNTVEYYAITEIRGDVPSPWVSLKDLRLRISRDGTYEAIDDFLPCAGADYSADSNYHFRVDTHTLEPNDYVDFHAHDFKKNVRFAPDPPAWGRSFYLKTAVTMRVNSPSNACYFGVFKYDASAEFYFQVPVGVVPVTTKSPDDIKISVHVSPQHGVFAH
jgi:hypothetical protein